MRAHMHVRTLSAFFVHGFFTFYPSMIYSCTMVNILCVYIFTRRFLSGLAKGLVLYGKPSNLGRGEGRGEGEERGGEGRGGGGGKRRESSRIKRYIIMRDEYLLFERLRTIVVYNNYYNTTSKFIIIIINLLWL